MFGGSRSLTATARKMSSIATQRLKGFDRPTVWHEFTPLANAHKAVNLGQGFPDWQCPSFCKTAITKAVNDDFNQYCRSAGEIHLVKELAKEYSALLNREIDPLTEVTCSVGATECLFAIMQAFIEPGDEVVMMEPAFDIYPAQVQMAGGTSVMVPLIPPTEENGLTEWGFEIDKIEAAITPNTRILLLNTPHNPCGRILSQSELVELGNMLQRHPRVIVVMDEVYENIVFSEKGHSRLAAIPEMWDRTITVSSSGKTFSITGWKIGWAIGPKELITPIALAHQWVQFSVSTPAQRAVADCLAIARQPFEGSASYYEHLHDKYERKLHMLADSCRTAGLIPLIPQVRIIFHSFRDKHAESCFLFVLFCLYLFFGQGSFFLVCDTRHIELPQEYCGLLDEHTGEPITRDWAFCRCRIHFFLHEISLQEF